MHPLLPEQDELLCELVDAYNERDDRPDIRVLEGASGARVWILGKPRQILPGRRKSADFIELRVNGYIRQIKKDKTGVYYALTPTGLTRRAEMAKRDRIGMIDTSLNRPKGDDRPLPSALTDAKSRLEVLRNMASKARTALDALLEVSSVAERFPNELGGLTVITPHPWEWAPLNPDGQRLVGEARAVLESWLEAATGAVAKSAPERTHDFIDETPSLLRIVERSAHSDGPSAPDIDGVKRNAEAALNAQLALVEGLPSAHGTPEFVLVPDTNALLHNPALDTWNLGDSQVTITVLPQVIAELDGRKMDSAVGEKAKSLIRRFKEYDRRGDTLVGVILIGRVRFREVAHDPTFDSLPSWLSRSNADDRILAGALDLAQSELASKVVLVTRDRNMQNKARRMKLPYIDIEDL